MPLINARRVYELYVYEGWTQEDLKQKWQQLKETFPELKDEPGFGSQTISNVLQAGKAYNTAYQVHTSTRRKLALVFGVDESQLSPILQPESNRDLRIIIPEDYFNKDCIKGYSQKDFICLLDRREQDGIHTLHRMADDYKIDPSHHKRIVESLNISMRQMDQIMQQAESGDESDPRLWDKYERSHLPFHLLCSPNLSAFKTALRSTLQVLLTYQLAHLTFEERQLRHEEHKELLDAWRSGDYEELMKVYIRHFQSFREVLQARPQVV